MARAPSRSPSPGGPGLEDLLAEAAAGRPAPVHLLEGDAFLTLRAARRIAEAIVPEDRRALNLLEMDAASSPSDVAAEISTGGLFGGAKVVLLVEPAFLQSREDLAAAFQRGSDQWAAGRHREAARRLVALGAKVGWGAADLDPSRGAAPSPERWRSELGIADGDWREADDRYLEEGGRYVAARAIEASRDDTAPLEALLAAGLPPGRTLVVAAGKVDGRLPIVKKLAAAGVRLGLAIPMGGTWDDPHPEIGEVAATLLQGTGKSLDPAAAARLAALVGPDARALAAELEKLAAYAGDRKTIRAEDVDAIVARTAEDPFFALGNAVESRDLSAALGVLGRTVADGGSPHMLVASLAGTVRRLVVEGERARRAAGTRRLGTYGEWQAVVLPTIPPEELGTKKPFGFWKKYEASLRFSRDELLDALAALAEADHAMKTGADGVLRLERVLVGLTGPRRMERRIA
jgi:DNA polymerase-3 subunit delta